MKYSPGTKLTVGHHQVSIIKYISEGGFAHVYTCTTEPAFNGCSVACLKRVVVPNKLQLTLLRQEVDAMRRLRGNPNIVSYIDLHAARYKPHPLENSLKGEQQYEVFLLMEYCSNNGLIDFMNQRLVHKLTEPEILQIMYDVTSGVAMCHHLRPPLIHRDIKIENVLIDVNHKYKLADFGSAVAYSNPPTTKQEFDTLKEDIMYHTTPQYRAPEMIDLSRGFPIDDKLDIWALGCFLYKLCYYTTPFERPNQKSLHELDQLILSADTSLRFNDQPGSIFSPRLKNIIKVCLREDPRRRPNAVQVLSEVCSMMNVSVPNVIPSSVTMAQQHQQQQQLQPLLQPARSVSPRKKSSEDLLSRPSKSHSSTSLTKESTPKIIHDLVKSPAPTNKNTSSSSSSSNSSLNAPTSNVPVSSPANPKFREMLKSATSNRPLSYIGPSVSDDRSKSSTSLQSFVHSQLESEQVYTFENNVNDLDFLRSKELELQQRNHTGGSIKSAFYSGLKRIGTGNSNVSLNSLNNQDTGPKNRRTSMNSIKQLLTGGGSSRKSSNNNNNNNNNNNGFRATEDNTIKQEQEPETIGRKSSIQSRMKMLMKSKDTPIQRTAIGYGKFTAGISPEPTTAAQSQSLHVEKARGRTIKKELHPPQIPSSLSSTRLNEDDKTTNTKGKLPPSKPSKKPPPKPKKPKQLNGIPRRLSNSSVESLPDVDDLERQFSKRFPTLKLA
ncbi:uncharacterized protein KQ657_001376 [Scheffersomyces spartinae]|uniref:non-specific serine/threonine protein kinase n=1 Tax=Scheffersomyces spartinae TaxID=45513 RepID=A0A9P7V7X7_9ASCO|nr:uncharacterized protein KQ657_001376 [Scheffersomyces spartinae]KAG7192919.1 hypothetical protein KQ657_001376 [Scheffersomyces spartinae]